MTESSTIDFGLTALDYARHRAGFPDAFFDRLAGMSIACPGRSALDLGTGTGTVARGLALRGFDVVGLDRAQPMLEQARQLDKAAGVSVRYIMARAEETGLESASFDLVTAGQCWHWFDRARATGEVFRLLRPGGRLVVAHFDWIPLPGNIAGATERLMKHHNPEWKLAGGLGLYPLWPRDMAVGGFTGIETFSFDLDVPYSHEAWRGRIRASAAIGAALAPERVASFDTDLKNMLEDKFPQQPLMVLHRVFAAIGVRP